MASIGRNQYGFETRASRSFEHIISIVLGSEILGHILNQDTDMFRQEELGDEDGGLVGDFSEEDILELHKTEAHEPHLGLVFRRPQHHFLNEGPSDLLTPYKIVNETTHSPNHHNLKH